MAQRTALYQVHVYAGAKMVDFGGWDMPLNYGSQIDEHHLVRKDAGQFDVSHMTVVDLHGPQTLDYLRHLLANNIDKLASVGKAMYSCMLNEQGGVVDDLIVYYLGDSDCRVVVNASTRDKDLKWMGAQAAGFDVELTERADLAMIAVQGPQARDKFAATLAANESDQALALGKFSAAAIGDLFVARTGYTGEDGFEIMVPADAAPTLWRRLNEQGVANCGLGARDTLRLEAGMNLYGQDMDEATSPLVSGLTWTVGWDPSDRLFVGREALEEQKSDGVDSKLVGLVLEDRGVLRHGQKVITAEGDGVVTSGSFSPTLGKAIGLARVPKAATDSAHVDIRGRQLAVRFVRPPFVRDGEAKI